MSSGVPVLGDGLLSLEGVLCPHSLGVDELALPGLDVAVQVRDQLVFLVAHSRTEVSDAHVCLLGPPSGEGRARNTLRMELHFTQTQIEVFTSHTYLVWLRSLSNDQSLGSSPPGCQRNLACLLWHTSDTQTPRDQC